MAFKCFCVCVCDRGWLWLYVTVCHRVVYLVDIWLLVYLSYKNSIIPEAVIMQFEWQITSRIYWKKKQKTKGVCVCLMKWKNLKTSLQELFGLICGPNTNQIQTWLIFWAANEYTIDHLWTWTAFKCLCVCVWPCVTVCDRVVYI